MNKLFACLFVGSLVAGGCYYFNSDRHDTAWWENERDRLDLQHRLQLTRFRLEKLPRGSEVADLEKAAAEKVALDQRISGLRDRRLQLATAIMDEEEAFLGFREDRLAQLRERALGKEWGEFVSFSGRVLMDAKVIHIDDLGVMFRHRDGSSRMRYQDLSDEQRCLFGLEEEAAVAAMKQEKRNAAAYEKWISEELDAIELERGRKEDALAISKAGQQNGPTTANEDYRAAQIRKIQMAALASNESAMRNRSLSAPARKINRGRQTNSSFYSYPAYRSGCGVPTYYTSRPRFFSASGEIHPYRPAAPVRPSAPDVVTPAATQLLSPTAQ